MEKKTYYYPSNLASAGRILLWKSSSFFLLFLISITGFSIALLSKSLFPLILVLTILFLTICIAEDITMLEVIKMAVTFIASPKKQTWANKTQRSLEFNFISDNGEINIGNGVNAASFAVWQLSPYNLSILPDSTVSDLVTKLAAAISTVSDLEFYISDQAEDFEANLAFLQKRYQEETAPAVKELLARDIEELSSGTAIASSRYFLAIYKLPDGEIEKAATLRRVYKALESAELNPRLLTKPEVKRVLGSYFGVIDGNKIPDYDGLQFV